MVKELIAKVLAPSESDVVAAPTDDTFDKALTLEPESFEKLFDQRVECHAGFSAKLPTKSEPSKPEAEKQK